MAVYAIDPHRFVLAGYDIVDGGEDRLPRTFYTPAQAPPRRHESFMVGIVEPLSPPEYVTICRQQVLAFITNQVELPV